MDHAEKSILDSYLSDSEKRTIDLFNALVETKGQARESIALKLADVLGNPGEFAFYINCTEDQKLIRTFHLLRVFRENVELLVHKTWANEAEEKPANLLFDDLQVFIEDYRQGKISSSFRRFVSIARAVPSLLFGSAGRAPDFLEYAFRIDPKFGLFFWYVGELEQQLRHVSEIREREELFRLETLLGAFILSCF
ncbi:MAG: hypothetical protein FD137_939 [Spirochaetes bacterium]|nr:MAG: hypothetical protein FD137_939 [Spirochaetota bacterium]